MRYLVFILLIVSCSPQKRLNRIIQKHPELNNTVVEIQRDTVKIPEIQQVTEFQVVQDWDAFDSLLNVYGTMRELMNKSTLSSEMQIIELNSTIDRIKRGIVKAVIPDTTFTIEIYRKITINGDSSFISRGDVKIKLSGAGVTHTLGLPPLNIPYEKKIVTNNIDATIGKPFYKDVWFWLFILVVGLAYLFNRRK